MSTWKRFQKYYFSFDALGFALDISRMNFPEGYLEKSGGKMQKAFEALESLEKGDIANPDENRQVGHYWLRAPELAPSDGLKKAIEGNIEHIESFAKAVHSGKIQGEKGPFKNLLCVGIGGSSLGPQFVQQALSMPPNDPLKVYFFDNTDPDGIDKVLAQLKGELGQTLCSITSKSGGTPETRNGMLEARAAWEAAGLNFGKHSVAVTGENSQLDNYAKAEGFIDRFPMWDWVGGRNSELAAVGLLPAACSGFDIRAMLKGAREMDELTRVHDPLKNPAALLALMWYYATEGHGAKAMVILPYKDRLELFSRYLQQLIMESLGKEHDLNGKVVHQGISVYGNKGSTDQHAYVQQLRDGLNNFFITFIEVLRHREGASPKVEGDFTSGNFLSGLFLGTRAALHEKDRESITISIHEVSARSIGQLIALYERAVTFYGSLVNINAYHQPGVEAGKKAAAFALELQAKILGFLAENSGKPYTAEAIAAALKLDKDTETIFKLLEHVSMNPHHGIQKTPHAIFHQCTYQHSS